MKHGDVTYEEARNQAIAFDLLRKTGVRIPRVYRYFQEAGPSGYLPEGYLMMEYIDGKSLDSIEEPHQIAQIAGIVSSFSSIYGQIPGPFETEVSHGLLWSETGEPCFTSIEDMERWLNFRLPDGPRLAL